MNSQRENFAYNYRRQTYDDFFNQSDLKKESRYFRHYISEDLDPIKIKLKLYDNEELLTDTPEYVFSGSSGQRDFSDRLLAQEVPELYQESLLEVPISRLRAEILEAISEERRNDARIPSELNVENVTINTPETLLWSDKYMPQNFYELLSDERTNREVLTWLKSWDPIVFKKKIQVKSTKVKEPGLFDTPQFPQKTYLYDLEDKKSCEILQNKIILLAGPPGSGKTTLARVIAKVCGYNPIEINASDERTSNALIEKIESITNSEAITKSTENYKPSLLILDEVDGTTESEYSGAIKRLMKFIYGEDQENEKFLRRNKTLRKSDTGVSHKERMEEELPGDNDYDKDERRYEQGLNEPKKPKPTEISPGKNKFNVKKLKIKRPIIFICNDMYVKSLKDLRLKALVFHFKKPETTKLKKRLFEICMKERLLIDHDTLLRICEQNDNDIRGCLNMLDFYARKKSNRLLKEDIFLTKKELTKNLYDVIDDLIHINKSKGYETQEEKMNPKFNIISYCFSQLQRNTDYALLSEGLFYNYTKTKQTEAGLPKVQNFLDSLIQADVLNKDILRNQRFEMNRYLNLFAIQAHLSVATTEKIRVEFPKHAFEINKAKKNALQLYEGIRDALLPKMRPYYQKQSYPVEYMSFVYQIIQPKVDTTILNIKENGALESAAFIMMDFGIELTKHSTEVTDRQGTNKVFSWIKPQIEKLLLFDGVILEQRMNERLHILFQSKFGYLKSIRAMQILKDEAQQKDNNSIDITISATVPLEDDLLCGVMETLGVSKKSKKRKARDDSEFGGFVYRYKEGFSNAVKYDVKMDFFFRSYNPSI